LLTADGQLVLGHPKKRTLVLREDAGLVKEKERAWGDSAASFYSLGPAAEVG
jgi:hypothetical protein